MASFSPHHPRTNPVLSSQQPIPCPTAVPQRHNPHVPRKCPWGAWCSGARCSWFHWWRWLSSGLGSERSCRDRGSRRLDPNGHSAHRWFPPPLHLLGLPIAARRRGESNRLIHKTIRKPTSESRLGLGSHDSGRYWIGLPPYSNGDALASDAPWCPQQLTAQTVHFYTGATSPKRFPAHCQVPLVSKGISSVDSFDPKCKIIMWKGNWTVGCSQVLWTKMYICKTEQPKESCSD